MIARRDFIVALLQAAVAAGLIRGNTARAAVAPEAKPFTVDGLKAEARELATRPYREPRKISDPVLTGLNWERYQDIRFKPERAYWGDRRSPFQLRFFHPGYNFLYPVAIHEVTDGLAHPIQYSSDLFQFAPALQVSQVPEDPGFAGFRIHYRTDFSRDMASFLGASYFRAVDWRMQYGLSARGLALDTALPDGEEFPLFKSFWIETPEENATSLVVSALLDSPSVTGAYSFVIRPGRTTLMDVEVSLFPR
jgi:periplasmic glucans biosynthesis protein